MPKMYYWSMEGIINTLLDLLQNIQRKNFITYFKMTGILDNEMEFNVSVKYKIGDYIYPVNV